MKRSVAFCLIFIWGVMPALSNSNFESVRPGNWAKVESLTHGAAISVKMVSGDKMEGEYMGLDVEAIRLNLDGQERVYPREGITEIRLLNICDPNTNGTLTGLAVGAATSAVVAYLVTSGEYYSKVGPLAAGIGAGIGSLIGYTGDKLKKGNELIYRTGTNK